MDTAVQIIALEGTVMAGTATLLQTVGIFIEQATTKKTVGKRIMTIS